MKSITPTLTGLASSLFLNVGLTKFAEKLDPLATQHSEIMHQGVNGGGALATIPCNFTPRARR